MRVNILNYLHRTLQMHFVHGKRNGKGKLNSSSFLHFILEPIVKRIAKYEPVLIENLILNCWFNVAIDMVEIFSYYTKFVYVDFFTELKI
jgi:hypothetical protein